MDSIPPARIADLGAELCRPSSMVCAASDMDCIEHKCCIRTSFPLSVV